MRWRVCTSAGNGLARRHAYYCLQLAQNGAAGLRSADQPFWLRRLDGEIDNVRAALAWTLSPEGEVELGLAIAAELAVVLGCQWSHQ